MNLDMNRMKSPWTALAVLGALAVVAKIRRHRRERDDRNRSSEHLDAAGRAPKHPV
ncbi:MAG: hypothetical protein ACR2HJ_11760 [Fimbriimonadales bacterium]